MTATMRVTDVPAGRKVRTVKTCPWWCNLDDDDHVAHGDHTHHSDAHDLAEGAYDAYLSTSDDGATVSIHLGVADGSNGDTRLSAAAAQALVGDLQQLVDIANDDTIRSGRAYVSPTAPRTDRETVALALLTRAEPHPATPAGKALEVLAGTVAPSDVVDMDVLDAVREIERVIAEQRVAAGRTDARGQTVLFATLVGLETQRRDMIRRLVEKPA